MKKLATALLAAACLAVAGVADAKQPEDKPDKQQSQGKPGLRSGLIRIEKNGDDRHLFYPGDRINISVTIPSSLTGYWSGAADAYIVVFAPNGDLISLPLSVARPDTKQGVTTLDTTDLAAGDYQLAFILAEDGGDPKELSDWYNGFSGLVSTLRVRISAAPTDPDDSDGDGEFDDDKDDDGYDDSP